MILFSQSGKHIGLNAQLGRDAGMLNCRSSSRRKSSTTDFLLVAPLVRLACAGLLAVLLLASGKVVASPFAGDLPENTFLKSLLEHPTISSTYGARLSPDGTKVLFYLEEMDVDTNADLDRWMVGSIKNGVLSEMQPLPIDLPWRARWLDAKTIGYFLAAEVDGREAGLRTLNVETGADGLVLAADALGEGISMPGDFTWRDDGGAVAVRGLSAGSSETDPGGSTYDAYIARVVGSAALFIYDVETRIVRQVTSEDYYPARSYDWSPSGMEIAFAYETRPEVNTDSLGLLTDLAVVSITDGAVRPLVTQSGGESAPVWSPDGGVIALTSQRGRLVYPLGWGAIIDPDGRFLRYAEPSLRGHRHLHWSPNGAWYLALEAAGFTTKLVRVDAGSGKAIEVAGLGDGLVHIESHSSFSFADDGSFVFIKSGPTTPPELYWSKLSEDGRRMDSPRRLTELGAQTAYDDVYDYQQVEWRSADDTFDLAGILVTPKGASGPLPTIVNIVGGPSRIRAEFSSSSWPGMVNAAVAAGYAVFTPTSRGRGGFGDAFHEAIGTGGSSMAKPWTDVYSGLEHLIEAGIADPDRLAVIGHSYGGALAAYGITQTDFAAAVIHEPGQIDRTFYIPWGRSDGWQGYLSRDLFGVRDRFDDDEQSMVIHESALWQADQIKTPALLQCGLTSGHEMCEQFLVALRELDAPAEYFVYGEGHTFGTPIAQYNDVVRTLVWIDYWIERSTGN